MLLHLLLKTKASGQFVLPLLSAAERIVCLRL